MTYVGLAVAMLLAAATAAPAQSLAEVARQEAERRKAIKTSGKVYTNESLRPVPGPAQPPDAAASTPDTAVAPAAEAPPEPSAPPPAPASDATPPRDEAAWRKRVSDARDALARSQSFAEALQSRINALSTDFVNRDDPAQRSVIAADRDKALAELDRVKQDIANQQKAITAIQDDARKAGIPAGWVR